MTPAPSVATRTLLHVGMTLLMRTLPCRRALARIVGVALGCARLLTRCRSANDILWAASRCAPQTSGSISLFRFHMRANRACATTWLAFARPDVFPEIVIPPDQATIDRLRAIGGGAILLGAHYGPSTLMPLALAKLGLDIAVLAAPHIVAEAKTIASGWSPDWRRERYAMPQVMLARAGGGERQLLRRLADGGLVYILLDVGFHHTSSFPSVPFFGERVTVSHFPFRVALKDRVPVLFQHMGLGSDGRYRCHIEPFDSFDTPEAGATQYAARLEAVVKRDPWSWNMLPGFKAWAQSGTESDRSIPHH